MAKSKYEVVNLPNSHLHTAMQTQRHELRAKNKRGAWGHVEELLYETARSRNTADWKSSVNIYVTAKEWRRAYPLWHGRYGHTHAHTCTHILKALPGYRHARSTVMFKADMTTLLIAPFYHTCTYTQSCTRAGTIHGRPDTNVTQAFKHWSSTSDILISVKCKATRSVLFHHISENYSINHTSNSQLEHRKSGTK